MSEEEDGVDRTLGSRAPSTLIEQVSHAAMWNAALIPLLGLGQLAFAVVVRRHFGLGSGLYDVLIGLMATMMVHCSVAMPTALLKFLPEVAHTAGPLGPRRLLRDAVTVRLLLLGLALVLMNVYAGWVSDLLELGPSGPTWIRLISAIALARSAVDMMTRALNAFFAQKWSNIIALVQTSLELALVGIALALGYQMSGLLGGLLGAALVVALVSVVIVSWQFRRIEVSPSPGEADPDRASPVLGRGWSVLPVQRVHLPFRFLRLFHGDGFCRAGPRHRSVR